MFIIDINYIAPLEEIERYLKQHIDFLEHHYRLGHFIASGRKNPRVGGIILCLGSSKAQVDMIIKDDPFFRESLAKYSVTEFIVTKCCEELVSLIGSN